MPTYAIPGLPGRLLVPGSSIGADSIASSVGCANTRAALSNSGISYVERRGPGGIAAHPPGIRVPASLMYRGPVAQETYLHARSALLDVVRMASAHDQSHPDALVRSTGA